MIDATRPATPDEEKIFCDRNKQAQMDVINRLRQLSCERGSAPQARGKGSSATR